MLENPRRDSGFFWRILNNSFNRVVSNRRNLLFLTGQALVGAISVVGVLSVGDLSPAAAIATSLSAIVVPQIACRKIACKYFGFKSREAELLAVSSVAVSVCPIIFLTSIVRDSSSILFNLSTATGDLLPFIITGISLSMACSPILNTLILSGLRLVDEVEFRRSERSSRSNAGVSVLVNSILRQKNVSLDLGPIISSYAATTIQSEYPEHQERINAANLASLQITERTSKNLVASSRATSRNNDNSSAQIEVLEDENHGIKNDKDHLIQINPRKRNVKDEKKYEDNENDANKSETPNVKVKITESNQVAPRSEIIEHKID